jgi:predicted Ser/Thr protein kinase
MVVAGGPTAALPDLGVMQETVAWPRDALPQGTDLFGYTVDAVIGRGGFGITYRAADGIDQIFAIKECFPKQFAVRDGLLVLPSDQGSVEPFRQCLDRFSQEARALRQLACHGEAGDGVVKVATFFQANGTAYTVMEFVDGHNLDQVIAAHPGGLPAAMLEKLVPCLLHAIGCVHSAGLLHRDIKPSNIILREDGRPVLIDFGAARVATQGLTQTYTQIFSEGYAPIEQFSGTRQGPFSDIYALGSTFCRAIGGSTVNSYSRHQAMLRGQRDPQRSAAEIGAGRYDARLLAAIDAAIAVAPEDRPQTVAEFLVLLQRPAAGEAVAVTGAGAGPAARSTGETPAPPARPAPSTAKLAPVATVAGAGATTRGVTLTLAGGIAVICAVLAAYFLWRQPRGDTAGSQPPPAIATAPVVTAASPPADDPAAQARAARARQALNDLIERAAAKFDEVKVRHDRFATPEEDGAELAFGRHQWQAAADGFAAASAIVTSHIRTQLGLAIALAVLRCHSDLDAKQFDFARIQLGRARQIRQALGLWPAADQRPDAVDELLAAQYRAFKRQQSAARVLGSAAAETFMKDAQEKMRVAESWMVAGNLDNAAASYRQAAETIERGGGAAVLADQAGPAAPRNDFASGWHSKAQAESEKVRALQNALDQLSSPAAQH